LPCSSLADNLEPKLAWNRLRSLKATLEDIKDVVTSNEKQRFNLLFSPTPRPDPSDSSSATESQKPGDYLIRANQGHSLPISSIALELIPVTLEAGNIPKTVVHGTYYAAWRAIMETGGLSRMDRGHVHFAVGVPGEKGKRAAQDQGTPKSVPAPIEGEDDATGEEKEVKVKSGMRLDAQVLVYIDVPRALQAPEEATRLKWWTSANNVILSEGDANGIVSIEWFSKVVDRKAGNVVLWERDLNEKRVKEVLGEWKREESTSGSGRGGKGGRGGGRGRGKGTGS
jgi:2'-phosphotransferase